MQITNHKHPADIADYISKLKSTNRYKYFDTLTPQQKASVFRFLPISVQHNLIKQINKEELSQILNNINPDDRTKILQSFPDSLIKSSINLLQEDEKEQALNLMGYPNDSIARLMTPYYIQVKPDWTVQRVFEHIKKDGKRAETLNFIYVVDEQNNLIDDLRIGELLMVDNRTRISELMDTTYISIDATTPMEDAFDIFDKYDRSALPIVTSNGMLVGIVTFDDIIDAIKDRDTEDIQKFGGSDGLDLSYTHTPLIQLMRKRAGWLVILFFGEMLTASAMGFFEGEIEKAVVLALFIPLIISSGGNSGSQAASLIIRAIAIGELNLRDWFYVMRKELVTGLMLGGILGFVGFIRIFIWQEAGLYDYGEYWLFVALTVGVSLIFIVLWGTLLGSLIPFALKKIGLDPATASAPFVATLVDVTGIIIYFMVAALFLSDRLL